MAQKPLLINLARTTFAACALLICGCNSLQTFDRGIRMNYGLSDEDLKFVQYYIDAPLFLASYEESAATEVTGSNIVRSEREQFERLITIEAKTPGVATEIMPEEIVISFDDDISLSFRPRSSAPNAPYELVKLNGQSILQNQRITFRGQMYNVQFKKTPQLLYEFTSVLKKRREEEKIKGKKL